MADPWLLVVVGAILVTLVGGAFIPRRQRTLRLRADRTAAKVGLALTPEIEPQVIRRQRRERRFSLVGGGVLWAGALMAVYAIEGSRFDASSIWFTNGAVVVGGAIGSACAAVIDSRRRIPADGPRLARVRGISLDDYLPRVDLVAARVCVIVSIGVLAAAVAVGALPGTLGALIGGLCLLSLLLSEAVGRGIVRQRQPATTTTELAWDDALRSIDLKAILVAPFTSASYAVLGTIFALTTLRPPTKGYADLAAVLLALGVTAVMIWQLGRGRDRDRHFLRRLWPATAAELNTLEQPVEMRS